MRAKIKIKYQKPDLTKGNLTRQELFAPCLHMSDKEECMKYKEELINWFRDYYRGATPAEKQVDDIIGYGAGGYTFETRLRIEELFECEHPYFGSAKMLGQPTEVEAIACGLKHIKLADLRRLFTPDEVSKIVKERVIIIDGNRPKIGKAL